MRNNSYQAHIDRVYNVGFVIGKILSVIVYGALGALSAYIVTSISSNI